MSARRRLRILTRWLAGERNGVTAPELARMLAGPTCVAQSGRYIESVEVCDEGTIVRLRGMERRLHWPPRYSLHSLFMVLAETSNERNWHFYEVPETRVAPGDTVADCGAAEGIFSLAVHSRARWVYAFEPAPHWRETLARTFATAENVTVLPVALGAVPGEAHLAGGALDSSITTSAVDGAHRVRVETIDRLFVEAGRPLSYLKADLEGWELEMLSGASRSIAESRPKIAITTYHHADHADLIAEFLRRVEPRYRMRTKGIDARTGCPVMLHAWAPPRSA